MPKMLTYEDLSQEDKDSFDEMMAEIMAEEMDEKTEEELDAMEKNFHMWSNVA